VFNRTGDLLSLSSPQHVVTTKATAWKNHRVSKTIDRQLQVILSVGNKRKSAFDVKLLGRSLFVTPLAMHDSRAHREETKETVISKCREMDRAAERGVNW
jgi:hypothetical protein